VLLDSWNGLHYSGRLDRILRLDSKAAVQRVPWIISKSDDELKAAEDAKQYDFEAMVARITRENPTGPYVDGWNPQVGEKDFKGRYYFEKFNWTPLDVEKHHALRQSYIEGLVWCLAYYYRGCISWGWFYPYHYGPMLSDLRGIPSIFERINFELGKPILPFQQLMSCLPPASAQLVPKPYQELMKSPDSPILEFYPTDFVVDMNGKKNPWEGIPLLSFIEMPRLLDAIRKRCPDDKLTSDERARNVKGNVYCYTYDLTCSDTLTSPNRAIGLVDIVKCNSRESILPPYESYGVSFRSEILPGTKIPLPGFPSLNVLPIASTELVPIGVNVFGMTSKYPTMVVRLHEMPDLPPIELLAKSILHKSLFINWPMMHEAKVVAITDERMEIRIHKGKTKVNKLAKTESERWLAETESIKQGYFVGRSTPGSGGVDIGDIKVRLKLLPLQGMKLNRSNGSTKKQFGCEEADIPLQLALWQAPAPDPRFTERGPIELSERFPKNSKVILTKGRYRGCIGSVVAVAEDKKVGVKVLTMPPEIPFGLALARSVYESYISSVDAARILKLHPSIFGKITGTLMFEPGKYDLGLNLKSSEGLCVAGFTRQKKEETHDAGGASRAWDSGDTVLVVGSQRIKENDGSRSVERIAWEYTPKAIRLVNEYRQKFPQLFTALVRMPNEKKYDADKVFGPNGVDWLLVIRDWLNNVESAKLPRTPITTDTMSKEAVTAVEKASSVRNLALAKKGYPKESLIKVPGSALYRESSTSATDVLLASDHDDIKAPELGDRIVNLCASGIPFGARGTVVGIHEASTGCVEVVMDEEFIGGTNLQGLCSNFRGKLCVWAHVMRITVEDSSKVVEKMVPIGSGKAAVDKILHDVMRQSENATIDGHLNTQNNEPRKAPGNSSPPGPIRTGSAPPTRKPRTPSSGKPRAASVGRDKQAGWQQAIGPPQKGNEFKWPKKQKIPGLSRWKSMVLSQQNAKTEDIAELKRVLGVGSLPSSTAYDAFQPSTHLKAILGVADPPRAHSSPQNAEEGLKAILGLPATEVSRTNSTSPISQSQHGMESATSAPVSAADELLRLISKQPPRNAFRTIPLMQPSFNFTYVEEGEETARNGSGSVVPVIGPLPSKVTARATPGIRPVSHQGHAPSSAWGYNRPASQEPTAIAEEDFPPLGGDVSKESSSVANLISGRPTKSKMIVPSNVKPN